MLKSLLTIFFLSVAANIVSAQTAHIDSLIRESAVVKNDTLRMVLYSQVGEGFAEINPDSSYFYEEKAATIAKKLGLKLDEAQALCRLSYALINLGNYPKSLQTLLYITSILENTRSEKNVLSTDYENPDEFVHRSSTASNQRLEILGYAHQILGILYSNTNNFEKSLHHHKEAVRLAEETNDNPLLSITEVTLARVYLALKKTDSALASAKKAEQVALRTNYKRYMGSTLLNMGRIYAAMGQKYAASEYYRRAVTASAETGYYRGVVASNLALADYFSQMGNQDSALYFINEAVPVAKFLNTPDLSLRTYSALSEYYRIMLNNDSIVKYQSLIIKINDSVFNAKQARQFQNLDFDEQQRQQQIEKANSDYRQKIRMYILVAGLAIFLFIAIILWRNSQLRKKANALLTKQKIELENALNTLKETQRQLIESEKMASLGELTAGIAHEIQNPLNFVNNFSEVNKELIEEMNKELQKGNLEEASRISADISSNEEKITFHGKRADGIVKSMLQHSRAGGTQKEPTDINVLTDECLRLSFHGMRAKDNYFNTKTETDFATDLPKVNIIPQDIGRVLLNLFTNAFYSVMEKKKMTVANAGSGQADYEPVISVKTEKTPNSVLISIRDNGMGIPEKVREKIFQPFFTTKPAGEGTGLGLSLSYDIITKGHGGELKVNTEIGKYAEFIIILPV